MTAPAGAPLGFGGPALEAEAARSGARGLTAPFAGLAGEGSSLARTYRVAYGEGADLRALAAAWAAVPGVERAEPEAVYRVAWSGAERFLASGAPAPPAAAPGPARGAAVGAPAFPDDPLFQDGSQWGLWNGGTGPFGGAPGNDVQASAGWAVTTGSTGVILSIVDTGCDPDQPELAGRLADGTPRVIAAFNSSVEGAAGSPADSVGHGTMVAGVALARANNGPLLDGRGVAGMCGGAGGDSAGCRVIEVKATPTHLLDALGSELAAGILYSVGHGARAINLSFGGDEDNESVRDAIAYAGARGTVVVCGAGNGQDARPQYPGYYARYGVGLSIAALRPDGTLAAFSSRGPQIDVAAPGEDIWSCYLTYENAFHNPPRNYLYTSGTSFAAPFVTGLAGLAMSLQPSLTDNEFQELLRRTADDLGAPGRDDTYGWGRPNAGRLLRELLPPRGFVRGTVAAQTWTLAAVESVTLSKTGLVRSGCSIDGRYQAERWEVRAHVALPPGRLLETPQVFVRTAATRGWRAAPVLEYNFGWGEAVPGSITPDGFDLRTYVYRIADPPALCGGGNGGALDYLPVAPRDVTFGWSAFGRLDAAPEITLLAPAADGAPWGVDRADTLAWEASDVDTVSAFRVELWRTAAAGWRTLATLPGDARRFAFRAPCATPGDTVRVRVTALDEHGQVDETGVERVIVPDRLCLDGESPDGSIAFAFLPVAPNPAVGQAVFRYRLPAAGGAGAVVQGTVAGHGRLVLYDARGRRLRALAVDGTAGAAGEVTWDGRDAAGRAARPGLYFARFEAAGQAAVRRFVLLGSPAAGR